MARAREKLSDEMKTSAARAAWAMFESFLAAAGARLTVARQRVCAHVAGRHDHFRADDVATDLARGPGRVSRGTVYRTLGMLVAAGLLREIPAATCTRYELLAGRAPHEHLLCERCGRCIESANIDVSALIERLCAQHKFKPRAHTLQVLGTCEHCLDKRR